MSNTNTTKGIIGIFTTGDVLGLNPAIRAVTIRVLREDYWVIGLRSRPLAVFGVLEGSS